ncbi:unnamed protein product [Hyaloperonospora brassicae]|uniref:Katanin p80 WD40 repeat-containing subunit B1 homolog n=1 Tax=Hyaloperonospora brassicae TaxID=162125 RepID=A0AAV0TBA3_HYABA|nr:unnamed protein product [Hyaloperonospora brassicae]
MNLPQNSRFRPHADSVQCVRFGRKASGEDRLVATGGDDRLVNVWKVRENGATKITRLQGHQSAVESIVFEPLDRKLVAGSRSGPVEVFDLEAGQLSRALKGHMAATTTLDYHLYGDYVASGSMDTIVKVWDLRMKSCMQTFKGHSSKVTAVSFTPDGRWLTSGDHDGRIRIWDLAAGRLLHEFADHRGAITSFAFNPEELILASSAADRTIRFWNVQNFAALGATPVDNATTTSMCHTVAEPYRGKYLVSCSQDAIQVWSYESGIECHDSVAMPRQGELDHVEVHADTAMTNDMKLMTGCIQGAFVSIRVLDVMQMRPFHHTTNGTHGEEAAATTSRSRRPPSARAVSPCATADAEKVAARTMTVAKAADGLGAAAPASGAGNVEAPDCVTRARRCVGLDQVSRDANHQAATHLATSEVFVAQPDAIARPTCRAEDPSKADSARLSTLNDDTQSQPPHRHTETHETDSETHETDSSALSSQQRDEELVVSDFVTELRSGMDTCVRAFKARQKCVQQLLVHWERGHLINGLRYIGELPKGKRAAVVVDVLRIMDLSSLDVDLEACTLLLPLIVELLESRFELYLSVGIVSGHKLLSAFSAIVKDGRDRYTRAMDIAGNERDRARQCNTCDAYFQEMHQRVQHLAETYTDSALRCKFHALARALDDFHR